MKNVVLVAHRARDVQTALSVLRENANEVWQLIVCPLNDCDSLEGIEDEHLVVLTPQESDEQALRCAMGATNEARPATALDALWHRLESSDAMRLRLHEENAALERTLLEAEKKNRMLSAELDQALNASRRAQVPKSEIDAMAVQVSNVLRAKIATISGSRLLRVGKIALTPLRAIKKLVERG